MTVELNSWFKSLPDQSQVAFLASLSHEITICGREFGLDLVGDNTIAAFKGLNELQHQISQHIGHLADGSQRYPDEVFLNILREKAKTYGPAAHLDRSVQHMVSRTVERSEK